MAEVVVVGKIIGTFGLKGALKVWPLTDFRERFGVGRRVFIDERQFEIQEVQWHGKQARVKLDGVKGIAAAEKLIGKELMVPADDLPSLDKGEFFVRDLVGIEVFDTKGASLGILEEIIASPAQDLYRVGKTLVPAVAEFVKSIDIENRRMVIAPIPGMFDETED